MTPGLAGFVASGDDAGVWDAVIAEVLAALRREFAVAGEHAGRPSGEQRRTWLDTFDWQLYRSGLILEYAAGRRGGELRLRSSKAATSAVSHRPRSGAAGAAAAPAVQPPPRPATAAVADEVSQPANGWLAARPHLAHDLPDGPVTARIASLIAPRALLPMVTVSSTTTVSRLLNADGKTVARLVVERPRIVPHHAAARGQRRPPGQPAVPALAPRLTITEIRGYPGQARRAARIVSATQGVLPAAEPVFADALLASGRRPGDYSGKVDAKITAAMPAAQAAAVVLLRLLEVIEVNLPGVLHDTDSEFLHDLRVSVRRTRSALKLFGDVLTAPALGAGRLTGDDLGRYAAEFKWVGDLTTPTRDLDVHLLGFAETAHALSAAKPDDLEPFRSYLEQRRVREYRALARGLRSSRFATLIGEWRTVLTGIRDSKPSTRSGAAGRSGQPARRAAETAATLAADRTRRAFGKVAKRGAAITPASPHEALHDLRKRSKELRYVLEFFAPLHDPATYGKVVGDLKRLQDCLGEFQDTEVQIGEIRALATAMLAANEAPAVTLLAMGEVTAGLAGRQAAARADFERRFAAFAGPDGQRRMSVLLRGGLA